MRLDGPIYLFFKILSYFPTFHCHFYLILFSCQFYYLLPYRCHISIFHPFRSHNTHRDTPSVQSFRSECSAQTRELCTGAVEWSRSRTLCRFGYGVWPNSLHSRLCKLVDDAISSDFKEKLHHPRACTAVRATGTPFSIKK